MAVNILKPLYSRPKVQNPSRLRGRQLQALRRRVFLAQGYRCAECGRITIKLELDHKIPLHKGGTDDESNLQGLCAARKTDCHPTKTARERQERT